MEVRRPVSVKLDVTEKDADHLHETFEQFRNANYVVGQARNNEGYVIVCKGCFTSGPTVLNERGEIE